MTRQSSGPWPALAAAAFGLTLLAACGEQAALPEQATYGPEPTIPAPGGSLIPTVKVATATGWPEGGKPRAAEGLAVQAFAEGLDHPRWVCVLPNGDVLVAESNAPPRPERQGIKLWIMKQFMSRAGAGVPSANRITLLRDADGDGKVETRTAFLTNLNSPFGMALIGDRFYVANADAVVRFPYREGDTTISAAPEKVADLPGGPLNHHWTKNIIPTPDGSRLYATVGSNSNVGENGLDQEVNRAAILEVDLKSGTTRLFASGLRNPNGMDFEPTTGALWTAVNERDELGSDLVPDYMTSVKEGGFYGWPYSYWGQHVDTRVSPPDPAKVAAAIKPDYALGNHTAPLGLVFAKGSLLPEQFRGGVFIGQHGSWNRNPPAGYRVIFIRFENGKPTGPPVDVLTGFLSEKGDALGRPVGVAIDSRGALLVADDVGNKIWRVVPAERAAASR